VFIRRKELVDMLKTILVNIIRVKLLS
jgi:hypothetical protein